jgi:hypothetical protein
VNKLLVWEEQKCKVFSSSMLSNFLFRKNSKCRLRARVLMAA